MHYSDNSSPIPGWTLRINEASRGHFVVSLADRNNRRVEINCADHELATKVRECVAWAQAIAAQDLANKPRVSNG